MPNPNPNKLPEKEFGHPISEYLPSGELHVSEYNTENLTPGEWRQLNPDEQGYPFSMMSEVPGLQLLSSTGKWVDGVCGGCEYGHIKYRFRGSPAELRKARGLDEKPSTAPEDQASELASLREEVARLAILAESNHAGCHGVLRVIQEERDKLRDKLRDKNEELRLRWSNLLSSIGSEPANITNALHELRAENARLTQTINLMRTGLLEISGSTIGKKEIVDKLLSL